MAVLNAILVFGIICFVQGLHHVADAEISRPMVNGKLTKNHNKRCTDQLNPVTCHGLKNLCNVEYVKQTLCCDTCANVDTTKRLYKAVSKTENKRCTDQLSPVTCHGLNHLCAGSEYVRQNLCCNTCGIDTTKRFYKPVDKTDKIAERILKLLNERKEY